ncbi:MAG: EI24 domain-containing protein [Bdellovibrio sp.]|nr:EI24 domain-containing protein [Bdellovibrio sp.]
MRMFIKLFPHLLRTSVKILFTDWKVFLLAMIPLVLGIILYVYMGKVLFVDFLNFLRLQTESYLGGGKLNAAVYYVVMALMIVSSYFIVGWTFVLSISILAAPFNSWLSGRVISLRGGGSGKEVKLGFFSLVWNELKKVMIIVALSLGAMIVAFLPFGAPISFLLSAFLISINFLDYPWSVQDLTWKEIVKELKGNTLVYFLCGAVFFLALAIPLLNLMMYPLAVIFYTCLQLELNSKSI